MRPIKPQVTQSEHKAVAKPAPLWTGAALQEATGSIVPKTLEIFGVSIDTRSIKKGDLFIALAGDNHDGHDHVAAAFKRGASACLVHKDVNDATGPLIRVDDTLQALWALARSARARFQGRMIGITGSVGKTTTKNMLFTALSPQGLTHAADKSFNNHIGVPVTLARLRQNAQWCICEIGMNHAGEIAPLARLVRPHVAIITAVGNSHIGYLGSLYAIAEEKSALLTGLAPKGTAIIPDDIYGFEVFSRVAKMQDAALVTVGASLAATHRISQVKEQSRYSSFDVLEHSVTLPIAGTHMIANAALVLAAVSKVSGNLDRACEALSHYTPDAGRGLLHAIRDGNVQILDESYNASSLSMQAALRTLKSWPAKRRLVVLGDMLEMGAFATSAHQDLLPDIVASADRVFCCGHFMQSVFTNIPDGKKGAWRETAAVLAPLVVSDIRDGDIILIKGSYGSRMRDVVDALKKQGNKG